MGQVAGLFLFAFIFYIKWQEASSKVQVEQQQRAYQQQQIREQQAYECRSDAQMNNRISNCD